MKTPSTKIAKMDDCNDSSSHGDSLLSSDSDGEYQVARGKTRQPQTALVLLQKNCKKILVSN